MSHQVGRYRSGPLTRQFHRAESADATALKFHKDLANVQVLRELDGVYHQGLVLSYGIAACVVVGRPAMVLLSR